ncbi:MAG: pectate lyase [Planctomycetes bacterium]|nr:pectate lyase [Planctomycetota bacterium]MBL7037300.1 pectate lyase [Pirellulaceae bacterium]
MFHQLSLLIGSTCCLLSPWTVNAAQPVRAFPAAEGFGAYAQGGRGGRVLFVTNLDDSGPGSLRAAIEAEGRRIVVFRTSGIIELKSGLSVRKPYITIAGQTAPGDGICLKNFGFSVVTHDVIVRHLRFRTGDEPGPAYKAKGRDFAPDAVSIGSPSRNVIFDHCSASWSIDECLSVSGEGITNVTVQWCMITESLNDSFHPKGPHGYGSLLRCNGDVTFHHNIYAHHRSRSPRPGTYGNGSILLDFRNNVIYDSSGYSAADPVRMNYIGNFIRRPRGAVFRVGGPTTQLYASGNHLDGGSEGNQDNWRLMAGATAANKAEKPFPVAEVKTHDAQDAFERILQACGATLPKRDAVDTRIVQQIRSGTGGLIDSQTEIGGWPDYDSAASPPDSDNDGMSDRWEEQHELKAGIPDHNDDIDRDGYTNVEEYLNRTDPRLAD